MHTKGFIFCIFSLLPLLHSYCLRYNYLTYHFSWPLFEFKCYVFQFNINYHMFSTNQQNHTIAWAQYYYLQQNVNYDEK